MADIRTTTYPDGTEFGVSITSEFVQAQDDLYTKGSEITIDIVINNFVGDLSDSSIEFSLLKPDGTLEEVVMAASVLQPLIFPMRQVGDYDYIAILVDGTSGLEYREEGAVSNTDNVHFEPKECGVFEIENRGPDVATIRYTSITGTQDETISIDGGGLAVLSPQVGVTQVVYTEADGYERTFLLNNSCAIEECMSRFIEDLLCGDEKACEMCPDETEVAQMMFFYNTYFMKIHEIFYQNSYFEALNDSMLNKITSVNQMIEKISEFCALFNPDYDCKTCF